MHTHRFCSRVFGSCVAWLALAGTPGAAPAAPAASPGDMQPIGDHGARLALPEGWKSASLSASVEGAQFIKAVRVLNKYGFYYLLIMEKEQRIECRNDCVRAFIEQWGQLLTEEDLQAGLVYSEKDGVVRGALECDTNTEGLHLRFAQRLLSRDGLTLYVSVWTLKDFAAILRREAQKVLDAIEFPGPDTEWGTLARPAVRRFAFREFEIAFSIRPNVFRPRADCPDDAPSLIGYVSRDEEHVLVVYDERSSEGPDGVLEAAVEDLRQKDPSWTEIARDWCPVDSAECRRAVARNAQQCVHIVAVPYGRDSFLELRYVSPGGPEDARADRTLFFETFRMTRASGVIAMPDIIPEEASPPPDAALAALLGEAVVLGDMVVSSALDAMRDARGVLAVSGREIRRLEPGAKTARLLYRTSAWQANLSCVPSGAAIVVAAGDGDGMLLRKENGEAVRTDVAAARVAPAGSGRLLVLRTEAARDFAGLGRLPWVGPDRVFLIEADGTERELATLRAPVRRFCANGDGSAVLIETGDGISPYGATGAVSIVPVQGGEPRALEGWRTLAAACAAGSGWVVTGRRAGGAPGLHLISADGNAEFLAGGNELVAAGVSDGKLTFLSSARVAGSPEGDSLIAYEIELEALRRSGPACFPWSPRVINDVAEKVVTKERAAPRTSAEVLACARAAAEASERIAGRPMPARGAAFDRLAAHAYGFRDDLSAPAEHLLALLLAAGLIEEGAVWVPGPPPPAECMRQPRMAGVRDSLVAIARSPFDAIASTLHDEEGMWEPAFSIAEEAQGRKILLGPDRAALEEAMAREPAPDPAALIARGDTEGLAALFRAAPENEFLRQHVYLRLAQAERWAALAALAGIEAAAHTKPCVDRTACFLARLKTVRTEEEIATLIADLRNTIGRAPADADICLFLGRAYELTGSNARDAIVAYQRVVDLGSRGGGAEEAQARLKALVNAVLDTKTESL